MSATAKNDGDDSEEFVIRDGETFGCRDEDKKGEVRHFADFSLKLVGEIHQGAQNSTPCEGKWLVALEGYVFGERTNRIITLGASDFDSKKQLLDSIRKGFSGGSVSFVPGVKTDNIQEYWRWLVGKYDKDSAIILIESDHTGLHPQNYWIVNDETYLQNNKILVWSSHKYALSKPIACVATVLHPDLLKFTNLKDVTKRRKQHGADPLY